MDREEPRGFAGLLPSLVWWWKDPEPTDAGEIYDYGRWLGPVWSSIDVRPREWVIA